MGKIALFLSLFISLSTSQAKEKDVELKTQKKIQLCIESVVPILESAQIKYSLSDINEYCKVLHDPNHKIDILEESKSFKT